MSLLTDALAQGTHAARPAAASSNSGRYYFETDTQVLFQSTGSAWQQLAPGVTTATYSKSTMQSSSDASKTPNTFTEWDSSLRVTVTVPASGNVLVRASFGCITSNASASITFGVQVDGAGGTTTLGALPLINSTTQFHASVGETNLTGLSAGSHTFYLMIVNQNQSGNVCSTIGHSNDLTQALDNWMSVLTLP